MIECGWGGREIDPGNWQPVEMFDGPSLWGHERVWLPPADREVARRGRWPPRAGTGDGRQLPADVGDLRLVGWGEQGWPIVTPSLEIITHWRVPASMTHMDDDQFALLNLVIHEIRIAGCRENTNAGDVGLAPKGGISGQQLTCAMNWRGNGGCRARIVPRNVFMDIGNIGVGAPRKTQPHRPHFFQRAAIFSSLTNSPRSA